MLKILLKAVILVFIILSIYFIVHPAACSNLMLGRVTNSSDKEIILEHTADVHREMFIPAGDRAQKGDPAAQPSVFDTNTLNNEMLPVPTYSQEDIDYAVASRYVELENNYAKENRKGKDAAKEISYIVMDDFELTQQEWEDFLRRATQSNLFNKVRSDMKAQ
ncbi:MAG: hypothetical protein ACI4Q7_03305 [Candidatus Avelusimicrobium sp.]